MVEEAAKALWGYLVLALLGVLLSLSALAVKSGTSFFSWEIPGWPVLLAVAVGLVGLLAWKLWSVEIGRKLFDLGLVRDPAELELLMTPVRLDAAGVGPPSGELALKVVDRRNRPMRRVKIDLSTDRGCLSLQGEERHLMGEDKVLSVWTGRDGSAAALLHAQTCPDGSWVIPGTATVWASAQCRYAPNIWREVRAEIVGSPAEGGLTLTAAPESVRQGETVTVTANVRDAVGQPVWDGTCVRFEASRGRFSESSVPTMGGVAATFLLTDVPGVCSIVSSVDPPRGPPLRAQLQISVVPPV
jgi:hypothetical protein